MQICKNCGKEIKFIATSGNNAVACDAEEVTLYTMNGRKVTGFLLHKCKGEHDGEKKH